MSDNRIPKFLEDQNEWQPEDFLAYAREGKLPLNPDYVKARNRALEDAGLEPDTELPLHKRDLEDLTPDELYERTKR